MNTIQDYCDSLQSDLLRDGALSSKEKALVLMGMNAAAHDEKRLLRFTDAALAAGANIEEIAEALLAAVISRGLPAWLAGVAALEHAIAKTGAKTPFDPKPFKTPFSSLEECRSYLAGENGNISNWAKLMEGFSPGALSAYVALRTEALGDGALSRKQKEYILIGVNIALGYSTGLQVHIPVAGKLGATEEQIREVFALALMDNGLRALAKAAG